MSETINKQHSFSHKYNNHHNILGVKSMCINRRQYSHVFTIYFNMCSNIYHLSLETGVYNFTCKSIFSNKNKNKTKD